MRKSITYIFFIMNSVLIDFRKKQYNLKTKLFCFLFADPKLEEAERNHIRQVS